MKKLILLALLLAATATPAFASQSFTVDAFTGHIHNYSTTVSSQLEVIINWEFKNNLNRVVAQGNKVVLPNSAGDFSVPQIAQTSPASSAFSLWVTITDIKNNVDLTNHIVDYVNSKSVAAKFTDVSFYNLSAIEVGEIKTSSGKSIADWLTANKQRGLIATLSLDFEAITQSWLAYYDPTKKSASLNSSTNSLVFVGVDGGPKPVVSYVFRLSTDPGAQAAFTRVTNNQEYTGVIPAAVTANAIIQD